MVVQLKTIFCGLMLGVLANAGTTQTTLPIWPPGQMPNDNGMVVTDSIARDRIWQVARPELTVWPAPPETNTGAAVLLLLGGGYARQATLTLAGEVVAWFNALGVNVFWLKYRLPQAPNVIVSHEAPIQDAQRAMRVIRARAAGWGVDTSRIGAMGFSAGGHLAATLGTHLVDYAAVGDALDTVAFRPDFLILISPVITMGPQTHQGSRQNLLGENPAPELVQAFSLEKQVTAQTPPVFLVHAADDAAVPPVNSLQFAQSLVDRGVSASLHLFPFGAHNIGLKNNPGSTQSWTMHCAQWLREMGF
ncbi:MAG: alpha/beta hydrolase [Lewinellaceae bacterium]|nr:alpha/beta hydrolase [Lewinellaceae bacterium]